MEINVNYLKDTIVNFDIVGKGNVLLDIELGDFDCSALDESPEADDDFEDYILQNINEIIEIISSPTLSQIYKDLKNLKHLTKEDIIEMASVTEDSIAFKKWCEDALEILIAIEDYENCSIVKRLLSYL